ncbi:MAG: BatD family protein [Helicobacteraceae bacterium]|nr:BatD family protein [Helicobacteraceae bacterium]
MKKNHGKSFFFLLLSLCASVLMGSEYKWSASINKTKAMTHEALYLEYICEFEDRGELYTIDFDPVGENELYDLKLLSEDVSYKDGKRRNRYEFVAFVKKAQKVDFTFDMVMKKTTQDSIDNTIIGRDNAQFVDYTSKHMRQETLSVDVEDAGSDLVGSFEIQREFGSLQVKAYEPFHLSLTLNGNGNLQDIKALDIQVEGVKVFAQEPYSEIALSKEGYIGKYHQKFAFVSEGNFTIPKVEIEYFDLREQRKKRLVLEPLDVEVLGGYKAEELLDAPQEQSQTFYKPEYLYYLLTFLAGYLVAQIKFKKTKKLQGKDAELIRKIANTKDLDELLFLLVLEKNPKFETYIKQIELNNIISLKDIQKDLYKLIKT